MYGDMLAPQSPVGTPPPVGMPPAPAAAAPPMPPLPPGAVAAPGAPMPGGPGPGAAPPPNPMAEQMARMQYEAQQNQFAKALAHDFVTGKIGREDLKKGAAYSGTQPYHEWKQENVLHLKASGDQAG